ncbi:MAG TPA: PAS domain S-box protein [Cytophagales bacterium]
MEQTPDHLPPFGQSQPENASLRQRAQQRLQAETPPRIDPSKADAQLIIHELQVYQAELELQNEDLLQSRAQIEQSRNTYSQLYESAPVAYYTLSPEGLISQCNHAGSILLGYPPQFLRTYTLLRFVTGSDRQIFSRFFGALLRDEGKQTCQVRFNPQQGEPRTVHLEGIRLAVGEQHVYLVAAVDLTEREQAREQARQQRELAETLLETSHDCLGTFDLSGRMQQGNRVLLQELGVSPDRLTEMSLYNLLPPFYHGALRQALGRVAAGERVRLDRVPYPLRNGFCEVELIPLHDGGRGGTGGLLVGRDVTHRIRQEEERQQQLRSQQQAVMDAVLLAQQDERKRMAEALHNGVGQILYAAKLNLENLLGAGEGPDADAFRTAYATLSKLLEDAIRETRNVSHRLVPQLLENFGLEAALRELVRTLAGPALRVSLNVKGAPFPLPKSLQLVLYRMAQELLQNLLKHAGATEAWVELGYQPGAISLAVRDNGRGFNLSQLREAGGGLGLRMIREQVDLLEGLLEMDTGSGEGTRIGIELPVPTTF